MRSFPSISFQNSVIAKRYAGPFKSKISNIHDTRDKSFQHKICEKATSALLTATVIPLVTYVKKWIKMFFWELFSMWLIIFIISLF